MKHVHQEIIIRLVVFTDGCIRQCKLALLQKGRRNTLRSLRQLPNENEVLWSTVKDTIVSYSSSISLVTPSRNSFPMGSDCNFVRPLVLHVTSSEHRYVIDESAISREVSRRRKYELSTGVRFRNAADEKMNTLYSPTINSFVGPKYAFH